MAVDIDNYTSPSKHARTLDKIKKCAQLPKSKPTNQRLGVQHSPILNIEPDHIVPDELHLLLRVGDILIRNLINHTVTFTHNQRKGIAYTQTNLRKIETAASEFGVTFRIWEEKDSDGKPSGKYEWTSIRGNDVLKLLQFLPAKFAEFTDEDVQATMARIWIVSYYTIIWEYNKSHFSFAQEFYELYRKLSTWEPPPK